MKLSYATWVALIERRARMIIVASVLVCVASALSLTRLRLDLDVLGMLPRGTPAFDDFRAFVADFGELDELFVLIDGAPLPELQKFADAFAARVAALDTVGAVHVKVDLDEILEGMLGRYLPNYLPESAYAEVRQRLAPEGIESQVEADRAVLSAPFDLSAARMVLQDPLGLRRLAAGALAQSTGQFTAVSGGYFTTPDGSALLMLIRPKQSAFDITFSERLMRAVRQAEGGTRSGGVRVRYTGSYVYALEDAAMLRWDVVRYTILALGGVLAAFFVGYRNLRILPFVTYPLAVTTLITFALSLLFFEQLNALSISFAAILYGLSIDSGIHFYTRLLQERQRTDLRAAVTATLAGLGRANIAASSTTAAAFVVIAFSCLSVVSQLGMLTAVGMLLTIVEFFTLYPALAFVFGRADLRGMGTLETPRLGRVAEYSAQHALPLATLAALFGVALLFAAARLDLDVKLTHLRPHDSEAVRVQDEITARFGERDSGGAALVRGSTLEQALADGERVSQRLAAYRSEGWLRRVESVDAVLPSPRVQQARVALFNALPRMEASATLREALPRHGFVAERFAGFLTEFERPRTEIVRLGDAVLRPLNVLIDHHVREHGGQYIVATYLQPAAGVSLRAAADRLRGDLAGVHITVAGRVLLEDELERILRRELVTFLVLALAGNFLLLLFSFQRVGTALAILAPVVLVVIVLFAGMWMLGVALDPVNLIVSPLLLGLGVDYAAYVVAGADERGGVGAAIHHGGRALVVTAVTTVTGFGFLGLSRYPTLATMGLLCGIGLLLCVVLAIVLLPALLTVLSGHSGARASRAMGDRRVPSGY